MRNFLTQMLLLTATTMSFASQQSDGSLQIAEDTRSAITTYFTGTLKEQRVKFENSDKIALEAIQATRDSIWAIWRESVDNFEEEKLIPLRQLEYRDVGKWTLPAKLEPNAVMPYYWGLNRVMEIGNNKFPMFLYMHGSGDKQQEWETGIGLSLRRFYSPGIYFVPQIPNEGEYYRWAIESKQWAWEKLLRLAFLNDNIDPNRIYFFGISEGGYGSQRLASFYADYLAGAGPMAGGEPLKNAPMENVANIAFSLRTGAKDTMFGRNILTQKALETADSLAAQHPGYYNHFIEVIPGYGHSIDYTPTTPWLAKYTRTPHPRYFYWENYEMYGRYRDGFYNLRVDSPSRLTASERTCYEMSIDNNTITLNVKNAKYTTTYSQGGIEMFFSKKYTVARKGDVTIFLNEELFDLSKPVKIILNGTEIFNSTVETSLKAMVESCALFYDPERLFPASISVDIRNNTAEVTSVEFPGCNEERNGKIYDINGRLVEKPIASGIYIHNGKKIYVK